MNTLTTDAEVSTTSGVIALLNLQAQIHGLETQASAAGLAVSQRTNLIALVTLRGQLLGRISDYEYAAALADQLVQDEPVDGAAFLARARTYATLHRFTEALADLDAAALRGLHQHKLDAERATIYQALGRYEEALALRSQAATNRADFATLGGLAGIQAERGEVAEAERLFDEGRRRYQGVSPFPLALFDFQRGLMWMEYGDLETARDWFDAAISRVPAYAHAQGHRAEVDAALGERQAAISRLRPLTACADDPEYAALLARYLAESGQTQEAQQWHSRAAARYDELLVRHPAAFADHAAEFWLNAGDVERALQLAGENLAMRATPRAHDLLQRALEAGMEH